jgi:TldD protein
VLDLLVELMDSALGRAAHAEVRQVTREAEDVLVRNGRVERVDAEASDGLGVRVRVGGGWGSPRPAR